jgi:imidazolonepropionase-like amidohydrolase
VTRIVLSNAAVLDSDRGELSDAQTVVVEDDRIVDVGPDAAGTDADQTIDARGRVVMPGLIDCHVHVTAASANLGEQGQWSPFYLAARASVIMRGMLERGFTTVRDAAGGDFGLARAVDEGVVEGPRLIFGGRALSQTGGHGDDRGRGRTALEAGYAYSAMSTICDGVPEVRRAVREEIKRGAQHIKLMLSGGVASPTDRVDSTQFSREEIRAAVEEAEAANIYVLGHAYTARAVNRGLECGVRSIEHGNLMDETSPPQFIAHEAFLVPTLVTYSALAEHGREFGLPEVRRAVREEIKRGAQHIKLMLSGGVASPTDRVDSTQFSREEIRAAVEEAEAANIYVLGHAYTARAVNRGLECGVRSIEHGNLMDETSPPLFIAHDAFLVPTLVTYSALAEHGREFGLPEVSYAKIFDVLDAGLHALELADRSGVNIAYGTDLLGAMHAYQSREFKIRAEVQSAAAIVRAATTIAARLLRLEGRVGVIAPGAYADLLVLDANPLDDINVLAEPEQHVNLIMKGGKLYRDTL